MIVDRRVQLEFIQGARDKALEVKGLAQSDKIDDATQRAKLLHRDAVAMIIQELSCDPLLPDDQTVLTIANNLSDVLLIRGIQGNTKLMRIVSKTYRLFVELCSYQHWRISAINKEEKVRVLPEIRDDLINTTKKLKGLFTGRGCGQEILFDLRCARQAAKQLEPSEALWKKYVNHAITLGLIGASGGATGAVDCRALWEALNVLAADVSRDHRLAQYTWSPKVHVMSWYSNCISDMGGFEIKVGGNVELCKQRGGNYSLCLATILINLIKRPDVGDDIKMKAFKGDGQGQEGLIHMLSWKPGDVSRGISRGGVDKVREFFDRIVKMEDSYWETRNLVAYYLMRLATKPKYAVYREESLEVLRQRKKELEQSKTSGRSIAHEKRLLQTRLEQAQERKKQIKADIKEVGRSQFHASNNRSTRGTQSYKDEEDQLLELSLKTECFVQEMQQIQQEIADLKSILQAPSTEDVSLLSDILDTEEEKRIEEIFSVISGERLDGSEPVVGASLGLSGSSSSSSSSGASRSSGASSSSPYG